MQKLKIIAGTQAADTLKESVRKSLRKTKQANVLQCPICGSRSHVTVETQTLKQKACVFCMMNEHRIVVME